MARLVDYYPLSDEELPRFTVSLKEPDTAKTRLSEATVVKSTVKKDLVPKTSSTLSARKVRRLGGASQVAANPSSLSLPWNADSKDGSRAPSLVSPKKAPGQSVKVSQQARHDSQHHASRSEPDWPPSTTVRPSRPRRQRLVPLSSRERDEQAMRSVEYLQRSTRKSRRAGAGTARNQGEAASDGDDTAEQVQEMAPTQHLVSENGEQTRHTSVASDAEGSSIYQTAAEDTFEYSDGSESEFEPSDSSDSFDDAPRRSLAQQLPSHLRQRQRTASTKPTEEACYGVPKPRSISYRTQEAVRFSTAKVMSSRGSDLSRQSSARKPSHLANPLGNESELLDRLDEIDNRHLGLSDDETLSGRHDDFVTPPNTPPKRLSSKTLVSPRKLAHIPQSPHRPSVDAFWGKDFVDDWNDRHSPRKPLLRPVTEGPVKLSPEKAAKKSFNTKKKSLAEEFFRELDAEITNGKIAELVQSTGGVKLVWTKALNTTAGRANWRRETTRHKLADGTVVDRSHRHHASIELAEKVIDSEEKLLSVLAHEFCHLANFMISGITNNPHGKEFKLWAARCSSAFGESRGIQVTTKHTYDIEFKYVWKCSACEFEYKRHSKSIDPQRHRCGLCKSALRQTRPVPRGGGAGRGKPSEYQVFVKEQMKLLKEENTGSPQKEVMRIVADRWASVKKGRVTTSDAGTRHEVDGVASRIVHLTLDGGHKG